MTKEDFEKLKSTVKQWLFHTGSLDPTNYANELKLKFLEPKEKRIEELTEWLNDASDEKLKLQMLRVDLVSKIGNQEKRITELEKENAELKARLFCIKESCDNCGFVKCENFQRQRKSEPCSVYISYKDRIIKLKLQLIKAKAIIKDYMIVADHTTVCSVPEENRCINVLKLNEQAEQFLKEADDDR